MRRLEETFRSLREKGSGALVPYVCAGDPDESFTVDLVKTLVKAGADVLELGLPFSDPVADGPVIQKAMQRSLSGGFRVRSIFKTISTLRSQEITTPIVVMTYYNPVLKSGVGSFCSALAEAGADGILVVDLPPEESEELDAAARANRLDIIRLVAPSTSDSRLDFILSRSSGFVYAVSVSGTTGARDVLPQTAQQLLKRIVPRSPVPVALGFGISGPQHVRSALEAGASGVVVGSKLVSVYSEGSDERLKILAKVETFTKELKAATVGIKREQSRP